MTDTQYRILLELFHEYNEAFLGLSPEIKAKFFEKLHGR